MNGIIGGKSGNNHPSASAKAERPERHGLLNTTIFP
jgi:hypothetical protein